MQKLGIYIYFSQSLICVGTFYPNTVYLQLQHCNKAFLVYKGYEKYKRIPKLHKNRENFMNSYVLPLTQFPHCYNSHMLVNTNIPVFLTFYVSLSLIMIVLSRYCPKYEMERQMLHGIQFHFSAPELDRHTFSYLS